MAADQIEQTLAQREGQQSRVDDELNDTAGLAQGFLRQSDEDQLTTSLKKAQSEIEIEC